MKKELADKISIKNYVQGSHRLEKYLNLEGFPEKSFKIKNALKSTITLYTKGFFLLVLYNKLGIVICTYLGVSGCNFILFFYFCLKIIFTFTNSVDPYEMQQYAAFHLGPNCLQKYPFRSFPKTKG